jgi:hypothetical protein
VMSLQTVAGTSTAPWATAGTPLPSSSPALRPGSCRCDIDASPWPGPPSAWRHSRTEPALRLQLQGHRQALPRPRLVDLVGILVDLGMSSWDLADPKGASRSRRTSPLDMRYDRTQPLSAHDVINSYRSKI